MATQPYRVIDRRSSSGYKGTYSADSLYKASRKHNLTRSRISDLNRDNSRNVSAYGRKSMVDLGRWLFANVAALRGGILEMANYAASSWIPQFYGEDKAWGNLAEEWLYEHDKICDIRGWPYTMATYRRNLVISVIRDGDLFTLLTETNSGYPVIQPLGCHRIGGKETDFIDGGEYDGSPFNDGVIKDDWGRVQAYRIINPEKPDTEFRDVAASDGFLSFIPENTDQDRGFSALASAIFDWQDISESRTFELLAQKVAASIALIEENESGEVDSSKAIVGAPSYGTSGAVTGPASETLEGGMIRYFRSGLNQKLSAFSYDRPGANSQEFEQRVIRAAFAGMGWSYDFSLDPTKAGGAQMRVVVEKINRTVDHIQQFVLLPALRRIDGWRISKAIKLGLIPPSKEWYKWDYQGPAKLTADKKYDSDVDVQELRAGTTTLSNVTAKRGAYWEDVRKQNELEAKDLLTRAKGISSEFGITMELAIQLLQQQTPNGNMQPASQPEPTQPQ